MTRDSAFARVPVACREIVQDLNEAVLVESGPQVVFVIVVGKEILDTLETRFGSGGKAVHEVDLVEHHR